MSELTSLYKRLTTDRLAQVYIDLRDERDTPPDDAVTPCLIDDLLRYVRGEGDDVMRCFERFVGCAICASDDNLWASE